MGEGAGTQCAVTRAHQPAAVTQAKCSRPELWKISMLIYNLQYSMCVHGWTSVSFTVHNRIRNVRWMKAYRRFILTASSLGLREKNWRPLCACFAYKPRWRRGTGTLPRTHIRTRTNTRGKSFLCTNKRIVGRGRGHQGHAAYIKHKRVDTAHNTL